MGGNGVKSKPSGSSRDDALSPEEWERLVRAAHTPTERLWLRLAGVWGMRADEIAHAPLEWISGQAATLTIPASCRCQVCRESGKPWKPKTKAGNRVLPLGKDPATWAVVKEAYSRPRRIVSRQAVHKAIRAISDRAGFLDRRVYPHALRATAATRFASKGVNEAGLCRLMGWANLSTAKPYIQSSGVDAARALDGVDLGL